MKTNTFFLIAALSSVLLSSCSNDHEPQILSDGASLNVIVEEFQVEGGNTRAVYQPSGNKLSWQTGDAIKVYDDNLRTYDLYSFSPTKRLFSTEATSSDIDGPISYALYPGDQVDYAGWTTYGNRAVMNIPSTIVYDESIENSSIVDGQTLYVGKLPMWGTASGSFGNVTVNLKYLCAVMKLKVKKSKATFVKIASATKPLAGGVEAIIAKNGVTQEEPVIKKGAKSLANFYYVLLDLRQMPSEEGYVYVPIIPDTYDDMIVSYTSLDVPVGTALTNAQIADKDEEIWTELKAYPEGKQFKRNTVYLVNL